MDGSVPGGHLEAGLWLGWRSLGKAAPQRRAAAKRGVLGGKGPPAALPCRPPRLTQQQGSQPSRGPGKTLRSPVCAGSPCRPHLPVWSLPHCPPSFLHSPSVLLCVSTSGPSPPPLPAGQQPEKQQTPNKRPWESLRKAHGPPAWVKKELEPLPPSPLELRSVEWEKSGATIPLVGQDIIDLQTEV